MERTFDLIGSLQMMPLAMPTEARLQYFTSRILAGFPSPADDHLDGSIDLNKVLVENEPATFITRASGDSMEGAGIYDGDLIIVNRALEACNGSLIVAEIMGEFTLKRLRIVAGKSWLYPENPHYQPTRVTEEMGFSVWDVVKHTIRVHGYGKQ